ncbi:MAG: helix-turn-helix domain-containing protein [Patescibacteria group bacterium]
MSDTQPQGSSGKQKSFHRRALPNDTLGEALRSVREDAGLSVEALGQQAGVQAKYIVAIEAGRYDQTPGPVYLRGFLRQIAAALDVSVESVLARFEAEPRGYVPTAQSAAKGFAQQQAATDAQTQRMHPRSARWLIAGGILVLAVVYFAISILGIVLPPPLTVTEPSADIIVNSPQVTVVGQSAAEVTVEVNGKPVSVDARGGFREAVDLQAGVNTLTITARKKRSRPATVTRRILVQVPAVVQ